LPPLLLRLALRAPRRLLGAPPRRLRLACRRGRRVPPLLLGISRLQLRGEHAAQVGAVVLERLHVRAHLAQRGTQRLGEHVSEAGEVSSG
jgi:hypothetical protein